VHSIRNSLGLHGARSLALGGLVLLAGCGESELRETHTDPDAESDTGAQSTVSIGTGFPDFVPITPGSDLPIIAGIQGGFHLWGGFVATHIDPRSVTIEFVTTLDGRDIGRASYVDTLVDDGGQMKYAGVAVIFDSDVDPDEVSSRPMSMSVRLEDMNGRVVTDSVELVPICCEL